MYNKYCNLCLHTIGPWKIESKWWERFIKWWEQDNKLSDEIVSDGNKLVSAMEQASKSCGTS